MQEPIAMDYDHLNYWLQLSPRSFLLAEVNEIRTSTNTIRALLKMLAEDVRNSDTTATIQNIDEHAQRITEALDVALAYTQVMK